MRPLLSQWSHFKILNFSKQFFSYNVGVFGKNKLWKEKNQKQLWRECQFLTAHYLVHCVFTVVCCEFDYKIADIGDNCQYKLAKCWANYCLCWRIIINFKSLSFQPTNANGSSNRQFHPSGYHCEIKCLKHCQLKLSYLVSYLDL